MIEKSNFEGFRKAVQRADKSVDFLEFFKVTQNFANKMVDMKIDSRLADKKDEWRIKRSKFLGDSSKQIARRIRRRVDLFTYQKPPLDKRVKIFKFLSKPLKGQIRGPKLLGYFQGKPMS